MRRSACGWVKAMQTAGGNAPGGRCWPGVGVAVGAVPDGDAGGARRDGEGRGRDAGFGGDVFEAALQELVLLAQPVRAEAADERVQEAGHRLGQGEDELGVVGAAVSGRPQPDRDASHGDLSRQLPGFLPGRRGSRHPQLLLAVWST